MGLRFFQQITVGAPGANALDLLWSNAGAGVVGLRPSKPPQKDETGRPVVRGSLSGLSTDPDGMFSQEMPPGTYRVSLMLERTNRYGNVSFVSTQMVELEPGQSVEQVFHVVRQILRVRFVESDGTPAVDRFLSSQSWIGEIRTDADGWVVLDPAPMEPVTFHTWPKGLRQEDVMPQTGRGRGATERKIIMLGPVQMPAGQKAAEFTLRLPPNVRR